MKKCTIQALKSKEIQGIFGKTLFWHYYLQLSFIYKTVSQISFTFPQISWLKIKFQKTETRFCRWKSTANNDINIFLSLENRCTFLLAEEETWKRIFNTNSELSQQNCTGKQIAPSKTTINCLFHCILCYLFVACFHWKIGVSQQTVVRVYYIHHKCASKCSTKKPTPRKERKTGNGWKLQKPNSSQKWRHTSFVA